MSVVLEVDNSTVVDHALEDLATLNALNAYTADILECWNEDTVLSKDEVSKLVTLHQESQHALVRLQDLVTALGK